MAAVSRQPVVSVRVAGQKVSVESLSVSSDSPLDLHLPPNVGGIAGSSATVDLAPTYDVTSKTVAPWSPTFRARPNDPATVEVDGVRLFDGVVGDLDMSLRDGDLSLPLVDPLASVDRNFSAPATLKRLAPLPGSSQERPVGCSGLFYVDRALAALGVNSTTRLAGRSVLHVPMAGSANAVVGTPTLVTQRVGGSAVSPWVEPLFRPMSGGRIGVLNPWLEYDTDPDRSEATVGSWHLTAEIDPAAAGNTFTVRARTMNTEGGFGFQILSGGDALRVLTWDTAGTSYPATHIDQGQTLTDVPIPVGTERVLLAYNVVTELLELRLQRADGSVGFRWDLTPAAAGIPPLTTAMRALRVRATGLGLLGGLSLMSRAGWVGVAGNDFINEPRGVSYDLSTARLVRWSRHGLPPVESEGAVQWLMKTVAEHRMFIYTDDNGVIHISDPADFRNKPVSHTIGDAGVAGDIDLDDVQVTVKRRQRFSRVRVTGTPVVGDVAWGPGMKPNRLYAGATNKITITAADDPVELWLEPRDGMFWVGEPDLAFRYAGEAVTEPWHKEDDFARGRGSWVGGFVRRVENDNFYRWATPSDIIYTVEQVTASKIKVTITPGPTLLAGEEYVNLPNPESETLRAFNPDKMTQFLPVIRGPGRGYYATVEGVSSEITPDPEGWGDLDEYVHEAGLSVQSSGQADELAQILADSHMDDFGKVTVTCALDTSVKVGQRVHVEPRSRSDVTLDGVVTGIPNRDVPSGGAPSMTLTLWVLAVNVHSVTYAERHALMEAAAAEDGRGQTYAADRARNTGLTYAQEAELASLSRSENLAPPLTSVDNWRAIGDLTLAAVTPGGVPAIRCLRASGSGVIYMDPAVNFQAPAGTRFYMSVDVRVTDPIPMRLRFMAYDGATGAANSPTVTQVTTDGWVTYGLLTTIGGDPSGYLRALVYPNTSSHPEGQGFYVRNYQVRAYT